MSRFSLEAWRRFGPKNLIRRLRLKIRSSSSSSSSSSIRSLSREEKLQYLLRSPLLFIGGLFYLFCLPSWPHSTEVEEHAFAAGQHAAAIRKPATPFAAAVLSLASFVYLRLEAAAAAAAAVPAAAAASHAAAAPSPCFSGPLKPSRYPFIFLPESSLRPRMQQQQQQQQQLQQQQCTEQQAPAALRELHALFAALQLESSLQPFYLVESSDAAAAAGGTAAAAAAAAGAAAAPPAAATLHFNFVAVARSSRGDGQEAILFPFLYDFNDPIAEPAAAAAAAATATTEASAAAPRAGAAAAAAFAAVVQHLLKAANINGAAEASAPAAALSRFAAADWLLLLQQLPPLDGLMQGMKQEGVRVSARVAAAAAAALTVQLQQHSPWLAKDVIIVVADRQLPYAAGLRAFAEYYFRGASGGLRQPPGGGPWGPPVPVHVGTVLELSSYVPVDAALPAAAAAAAAAEAAAAFQRETDRIEADTDEAAAAAAAAAANAASLSAGARWTDPHVLPRKLTLQQLAPLQLLLQQQQEQQGQQQQQQQHHIRGDLVLPDFGSLSFVHVDFEGADGQVANEDIANVLIMEARSEAVPMTLRSFWEQVWRPAIGAGAHTSVEPLLREGINAAAAVVHPSLPGGSSSFSWAALLAMMERMAHSCSNVESSLFRSFASYFFISRNTHVSGGTFIFITPLLVLSLALPLLASRVVSDFRIFAIGILSVAAAVAAALPDKFGLFLFGKSAAPLCTQWDPRDLVAYAQKAAIWLYLAVPAYVLLLVLLVYFARRIRRMQLQAGEHESQQSDPGALFVAPSTPERIKAATYAEIFDKAANKAAAAGVPRGAAADAAAGAAAAGVPRGAAADAAAGAAADSAAADAASSAAAVRSSPEAADADGAAVQLSPQQQAQQQKEQQQQEELQQQIQMEAANVILDNWLPPSVPPPVWICLRACCRFYLVVIMLTLLPCNVSLSWLLGVLLLPPLQLLQPILAGSASKCQQQRQQQQQQQQQEKTKSKADAKEIEMDDVHKIRGDAANMLEQQQKQQKRIRRWLLLRKAALLLSVLLLVLLFTDFTLLSVSFPAAGAAAAAAAAVTVAAAAAAAAAGGSCLIACVCEQPVRQRLFEVATDYAMEGAAALSNSKFPSPELLLQWLGSGVLQQQQLQQHHMPFNAEASAAAGDAFAPALVGSAAVPAAWSDWQQQQQQQHREQLQLLKLPLAWQLLPKHPNSLLLLLYGLGRDAVCIGSSTFALFVFGLLPLCFFFTVLLFLPS
ncbi:glycosylphosphatidylinositol anchor attachment 1 protein, putative [Eimeria necatrix]|uniref:Glycosylphosphatidylinositol anchor attachment 1 protein, putative n=1 Tax=Eimeria necatrix TaxID=51315 RepID=U6MP68_9EIME|nr:glycosylphosphatidylinositol anchor attachment 1 protein, putative [Eimeria necatrix]CDJ64259.1 glycosylphosphatidylinositol anchor attachment 1 protein, putative [Eimeria necatrix]